MIYLDDMNLVISWRNRNVVTIQTCLYSMHKKRPIGFYTYGSFIYLLDGLERSKGKRVRTSRIKAD